MIHSEGDKTIIHSSGLVSQSRVTISSSSWINIEPGFVTSAEVGSPVVASSAAPVDEPVKPPRLKKERFSNSSYFLWGINNFFRIFINITHFRMINDLFYFAITKIQRVTEKQP